MWTMREEAAIHSLLIGECGDHGGGRFFAKRLRPVNETFMRITICHPAPPCGLYNTVFSLRLFHRSRKNGCRISVKHLIPCKVNARYRQYTAHLACRPIFLVVLRLQVNKPGGFVAGILNLSSQLENVELPQFPLLTSTMHRC